MAKTKEMLVKEAADAQAALQAAREESKRLVDTSIAEMQGLHARHAAELQELREAHATLMAAKEKELKSANDVKKLYSDRADECSRELDMIHLVIDQLAGAPPREAKAKPDDYAAIKLNVVARLAGYLAIRP